MKESKENYYRDLERGKKRQISNESLAEELASLMAASSYF